MIARTVGSASSAGMTRLSSSIIAPLRALSAAGRLSRMMAYPSSRSRIRQVRVRVERSVGLVLVFGRSLSF